MNEHKDQAFPRAHPLLLGVDGGGTKTLAVVATIDADGAPRELGRGRSGPSNIRLAGSDLALASLGASISAALADAGLADERIDSAVLALAGASGPDIRTQLDQWIGSFPALTRVRIIPDTEPVLAEGTPDGWGIALLIGTGSVASGLDATGRSLVKGGWGHWFGDRGSGYDLGRQALAAAAEMDDGYGPETTLLASLKEHFEISNLRHVVQWLATSDNVRKQVAAATPAVMAAAEAGDEVALRILSNGVGELSRITQAVANGLGFKDGYPLAMAGSVICHNVIYRELLLPALLSDHPCPGPIEFVSEPMRGCLDLALRELRKHNGN